MKRFAVLTILALAATGCMYEASQTPAESPVSRSVPAGAGDTLTGEEAAQVRQDLGEVADLRELKTMLEDMKRSGQRPDAETVDRILERVEAAEKLLRTLEARLETLE